MALGRYEKIGWENRPSVKTPVSAENLGKMDDAIYTNREEILKLQSGETTRVKWENVENSPFWTVVEEGELTWDGDITDKVVASDGQHYLILEDVSCADALKEYGGGITLSTGGAGYGVTGDGVTVDGDCLAVKDYVIVALANNAVSNGITYPRKGIYFKSSEDEYVSSFATNSADYLFPIVVSKDKLGEKYLPDSVIMEDDLNAYDVEIKAYIDAKIASSGGTSAPSAEGVAF